MNWEKMSNVGENTLRSKGLRDIPKKSFNKISDDSSRKQKQKQNKGWSWPHKQRLSLVHRKQDPT